jgi:hypothetical protein
LTIGAFLLWLAGVFVLLLLPALPAQLIYLGFLAPVVLLVAMVYERSILPGVPVSQRLRLVEALCMGFAGVVLIVGAVLAGSNTALLVAAVVAGSVLGFSGPLTMAVFAGRRAHRERLAGAGARAADDKPSANA